MAQRPTDEPRLRRVKRSRWKLGSAEIEFVSTVEHLEGDAARRAAEAFRQAPGSLDADAGSTLLPAGQRTVRWNQPFQRLLLFVPAIVAVIWWKVAPFSGWSWIVPLLAIPPTLLYFAAAKREIDADAASRSSS